MTGVDTTFIIDLFRGSLKATKLLEDLWEKGERVSTTVINLAELYRGAFSHSRADEKLREIEDMKDLLVVLDMKAESAKLYGRIYAELKKKGKIAKDRDIVISSIFLSFGERKIITRDEKHFRDIGGIEVVAY
ncbi:MAG: type II toxin-antitoxin system VapC family toxin [Methanobacteriota archaeon]